MSQSATLYAITPKSFKTLHEKPGAPVDLKKHSVHHIVFQGTFIALEFLINKALEYDEDLSVDIFQPKHVLGSDVDFAALDEEQLANLEGAGRYLSPAQITEICDLIEDIDEPEIDDVYSHRELNQTGIYPGTWNNSFEEDAKFNLTHVLSDYILLKQFLKDAKKKGHYVLCYVG